MKIANTSPECRNAFECPQACLSLDFHCSMSVSEVELMHVSIETCMS